jgi:outer membrane protein TolC
MKSMLIFCALLCALSLFGQDSAPYAILSDQQSEATDPARDAGTFAPPNRPTAAPVPLQEWLNLALKYNPAVLMDGRELEIAREKRNESIRAFMPTLNLNLQSEYYGKIQKQMLPAASFGGPEGQYKAAEMGVPLNITGMAQANQLIYNRAAIIGTKQTALGIHVSELQSVKTKEDLAWQVTATYYRAQSLQKQKSLLEQNVANLDRLIEKTRLLARHTLARQSDVDKLLVQKNLLENDIANAADDFEALLRYLRTLADPEYSADFTIAPASETTDNFPAWAGTTTVHRTESDLLIRRKQGLELEYESILARRLPMALLFAKTGLTDFGKFGNNGFNEIHGFGSFGLQVSWNAFDGGARRSKARQKALELQKLSLQQEQLDQNINREVADAQARLHTQYAAIRSQQKNMALAEKLFGQCELQFREGLVGIQEVIDRQNALTQAQTGYVNALIQFRLAELDLKKASGGLLGKD